MSKGSKTRVVIEADGVSRELFSVRQLSSGELQIVLKVPREAGSLNGPFDEIKQLKFSLHLNSVASNGSRTMKRTLVHANGRKRVSAAYWRPSDGAVRALLFTCRPPALNSDSFLHKVRGRDSVMLIGSYNPRFANLAYVVFVGDRGALNFQMSGHIPFVRTLLEFDLFEVVIYHTFMNAPSLPRGELVAVATSSEVWEGERPEFQIAGGSNSILLGNIDDFLTKFQIAIRNTYMHQAVNFFMQSGMEVTDQFCHELEVLANVFSNAPISDLRQI